MFAKRCPALPRRSLPTPAHPASPAAAPAGERLDPPSLFAGRLMARIPHGDEIYALGHSRSGKRILTK